MSLLAIVKRALGANAPVAAGPWRPTAIGPRFDWLGHDRIIIRTGPLTGAEFRVVTEIEPDRAAVHLHDGEDRVGQCLLERRPPVVELWDVGVRPKFRRGGLCAVMTWLAFRALLAAQRQAGFRIRMITSVRPDEETLIQNIGICIVANRLGMTGDYDPDRLLAGRNFVAADIIPARDGSPAGLKLTIREYPLLLIAVALDPDTRRPATSFRLYQQLEKDPALVRDWARRGLLVVSNGDYSLRAGGVERFVNALALDADEAADFRRRILPLS